MQVYTNNSLKLNQNRKASSDTAHPTAGSTLVPLSKLKGLEDEMRMLGK